MKSIASKVKYLILLLIISLSFAQNNKEFRATWVITWEHNCDSTKIKQILDRHAQANMNAVLFQVRQSGTAYYNSSYEPWGYYANYQNPGFDPLAFAVKEAHKRGLELHAWFNTFQASSTVQGTPAQENPEWVCRDGDNSPMPQSKALSPGLDTVRSYTRQVAMEIVRNYDIDGIHLDYVRWNEYDTGDLAKPIAPYRMMDKPIPEAELERLSKVTSSNRYLFDAEHKYSDGVPASFGSWEEWWRWSVTEFVKTLHDSIQEEKPWVRLSAAALGNYRWGGWQGYGTVYQDACKWYNKEYIDQLTPMHYHWTTADGFYSMLDGYGDDNWGYWLEDTSDVLFSVGPGSYMLADNNVWDRHGSIVESSRNVDWVDGFQFFSYGTWASYDYWEEAGATFFDRKTKIDNVFEKQLPGSPTLELTKIDSLMYSLYIIPDESVNQDQWFAIYRSEDDIIEPENDEIIEIAFGDSAFFYVDEFSGNQNFDGKYHYGATCLNRYWNESAVSNTVTTDSIPSFPPVVIYSEPTDGDSIPVSSNLTFEFSKEIEAASFSDGFSIEPDVPVESIDISDKWYNAGKVVTVNFSEKMEFGTNYQIILDNNITDLNQVALDGNGDGDPGDQLSINFTTYTKDLAGPQIVSVEPAENTLDLDGQEAINIVFDELIDPESMNESSITLLSNGNPLLAQPLVSTFANQSIVTIKPYSQFINDGDVVVSLSTNVKDTAGNPMESRTDLGFHTLDHHYTSKNTLDNFGDSGDWWDPEGSGSTAGVIGSNTNFGINKTIYLPDIANSQSGRISYEWDQNETSHFLRVHDPSGEEFDTTHTLQCYVYGDGSYNKFRFSCYEYGGNDDVAEVSTWKTIDWVGWKLVEWDLGDPNSIGFWSSDISNGEMDGNTYRLESFQMEPTDSASVSGAVYVDNLRLVKKDPGEAPPNYAPVVEELDDTTISKGDYCKVYVNYTDQNGNDDHQIIPQADTSAILFSIKGHTPGSRVYVVPKTDYVGQSEVSIIVRDYGVGELADTTTFTLNVTTSGVETEHLVKKYTLSQNYPNPFNPTTKIDFTIPQVGNVAIAIYDLTGRKVAEPINDFYQPGAYNFTFDASDLSSGVYLYRLITNNKVITRKMMLLK